MYVAFRKAGHNPKDSYLLFLCGCSPDTHQNNFLINQFFGERQPILSRSRNRERFNDECYMFPVDVTILSVSLNVRS